jgi:hypothetical protein
VIWLLVLWGACGWGGESDTATAGELATFLGEPHPDEGTSPHFITCTWRCWSFATTTGKEHPCTIHNDVSTRCVVRLRAGAADREYVVALVRRVRLTVVLHPLLLAHARVRLDLVRGQRAPSAATHGCQACGSLSLAVFVGVGTLRGRAIL